MSLSTKDMYVKLNRGSFLNGSLSKAAVLVWLFAMTGALMAEDFTYRITPSKTDPYLKEPILLRVDLNQTNPDVVLLFQFKVNPDKHYIVRPLLAQHNDTLHHTKLSNLYELYPLQTGDINVTFSLVKRVTDDAKVRYFSSGDRDDFKKLETEDFPITLPPLRLHVRPLPKGTVLVGEYRLDYKTKTHHAKAYTPIPITVTITGRGYPPEITDLFPKGADYTLFTEKPKIETISTPQGSLIKARYIYAISAQKSFTLPAVELHAFNPFEGHAYTLKIPEQHFEIEPVETKQLVDRTDSPKPFSFEMEWLWTFLGYLAAFIAGYGSALLWKRRSGTSPHYGKDETTSLHAKIEDAKDAKSLLQILLASNDPHFREAITALEAHLYKSEALDLRKCKQRLYKQTKQTQGES